MTRLLRIDRVGQYGEGLAGGPGEPAAVSKTLPSELIEVSDGKLVRILEPSADRITPFCAKHDVCGGCKLQHWRHEAYARWKLSLLAQALAAKSLAISPETLIDAHGEGRRRATLHVRRQEGGWTSGYMQLKSHSLCALDSCPVLEAKLQHAPLIAASFGPVFGACDVALTAAENGIDVAIKAERKSLQGKLDAIRSVFERWKLSRVAVNGEPLMAQDEPFVMMGGVRVNLPVNAFLQATRAGEETLARLVLDGAGKCKKALDLFCGLGPFALRLAKTAAVTAVDGDKSAVAGLQTAARHAPGLKPVAAHVRDLFRSPLTISELEEHDLIVLDPPRAGAEAQARNAARSRVKSVVVVGCDAQTFARDAAILAAGGYRFESVFAVDQFKWTAHLEMVGWFRK